MAIRPGRAVLVGLMPWAAKKCRTVLLSMGRERKNSCTPEFAFPGLENKKSDSGRAYFQFDIAGRVFDRHFDQYPSLCASQCQSIFLAHLHDEFHSFSIFFRCKERGIATKAVVVGCNFYPPNLHSFFRCSNTLLARLGSEFNPPALSYAAKRGHGISARERDSAGPGRNGVPGHQ